MLTSEVLEIVLIHGQVLIYLQRGLSTGRNVRAVSILEDLLFVLDGLDTSRLMKLNDLCCAFELLLKLTCEHFIVNNDDHINPKPADSLG
jgi:hypothetical protein